MLTQTLPFFGINLSGWMLKRMLKGCFNFKPPKVRYSCTWDVKTVLKFLYTLYPLEDLSLKCLTFKLIALIALTTAARAQSLSALDLKYMSYDRRQCIIVFHIQKLLKTSRPGVSLPAIVLKRYEKPELCVVKTLLSYINRTKDVRKTSSLFISFVTYDEVTTSTLARWLKSVLELSGINSSIFKAHSFRGAAASAAFLSGCKMKDILLTANWSNAETFYKFYHKKVVKDKDFANAVLQ